MTINIVLMIKCKYT